MHLLASYLFWKHRGLKVDGRGLDGLGPVYTLASPAERRRVVAWLDSAEAQSARRAIESTGAAPEAARLWLRAVTEDPASGATLVSLVTDAQRRGSIPTDNVAIERWLLVREALEVLQSPAMAGLGDLARGLTCAEIAALAGDDPATRTALAASGIRFREFAKMVTGRRFSAGLFHWEECGIRRSWLWKVPPRDWVGFGRVLLKMGGLGPMMFPHLNPRRTSPRLEEPGLSRSLAVLAESIERRPDLRGFAAASWLRSPDTHRVSPRLAAVNAPVLAHGGFVTTVGRAPEDCGVFACSETRKRLYDEGTFTPTIGLVLWPRADMLRWWRAHAECAPAEAA